MEHDNLAILSALKPINPCKTYLRLSSLDFYICLQVYAMMYLSGNYCGTYSFDDMENKLRNTIHYKVNSMMILAQWLTHLCPYFPKYGSSAPFRQFGSDLIAIMSCDSSLVQELYIPESHAPRLLSRPELHICKRIRRDILLRFF